MNIVFRTVSHSMTSNLLPLQIFINLPTDSTQFDPAENPAMAQLSPSLLSYSIIERDFFYLSHGPLYLMRIFLYTDKYFITLIFHQTDEYSSFIKVMNLYHYCHTRPQRTNSTQSLVALFSRTCPAARPSVHRETLDLSSEPIYDLQSHTEITKDISLYKETPKQFLNPTLTPKKPIIAPKSQKRPQI